MRRRRPLLRGAAAGAAGYAIGKRAERRNAEGGQEDEYAGETEEDAGETEEGTQSSAVDELRQLAELKKEGILTDEEFQAEKEKILGRS